MITLKGTTNKTVLVYVANSTTGLGLTGLVFNSSGLTASYARPGAVRQAISLVTQTVAGAHTDGGFVEIDAVNMPGVYRLDVPDAAFASGVDEVYIYLHGATNMVPVAQRVQLSAIDIQNANNAGMSSLPGNAAGTLNGLPLSDASGRVTVGDFGTEMHALLKRYAYRTMGTVYFVSTSLVGDGSRPEIPTLPALAAILAAAGDTIQWNVGTYTLSPFPLVIPDGVNIVGAGKGLTKITHAAMTAATVVLGIGSNSVVEGVTVESVSGLQLGGAIGARFATDRRLYNTTFRRCEFIGASDACFLEAPTSGLEHRVVFEECDFVSDFDGITTSSATAVNGGLFTGSGPGVALEVWLYRCRFSPRGSPTDNQKHIFANHGSDATRKQRIYAIDTTFERKTSSVSTGGTISADGPGIEIYLINCSLMSNDDNVNSLLLQASNGAKIYVGPGTAWDREKSTTATGGQIIEFGGDLSTVAPLNNLDAAVTSRASSVDLATVDGGVDWISNAIAVTLDPNIVAIKGVTDKINTALEESGTPGVFQLTTVALENAPTGGVDAQAVRDAMKLAPSAGAPAAGSIDDLISGIESPAGGGDTSWTITVNDGDANPIANCKVWIRSVASEAGQILASGFTNDDGEVTFFLDDGVTYYAWRSADGFNFTNPQSFTVSA